jgi:hypothetical protein
VQVLRMKAKMRSFLGILVFVLGACSESSNVPVADLDMGPVEDVSPNSDSGEDTTQVADDGEDIAVDADMDADTDVIQPVLSRVDYIDDQDFVIPSNAEVGDTVGHAKPYPTLVFSAPVYRIVGGDEGVFSIDATTGLVSVVDVGALTVKTYEVEVELRDREADTAVLRIRVVSSESVTFIDPSSSSGMPDGSRANPLSAWPSRLTSGRTYLQRRGTTYETSDLIEFVDDTLMGAYGVGARPRITASGGHLTNGYRRGGVTIRDLALENPGGTSLIYFNNGGTTPNVVDNCELSGAEWAIRMTGTAPRNVGHRVLYTEIRDIADDGMYMQNADGVEIGYSHVHRVNSNWRPPTTSQTIAAGDAVQFVRADGFHVHHSLLDRSDSGNKFALIAAGSSEGIIEHNTIRGPLNTPEGGAGLYLGNDVTTVTVRFNRFERGTDAPPVHAIYMHAPGTQFHGNVFNGVPVGIGCRITDSGDPCEIFNNVFYNVSEQIVAGRVVARNNIFFLREGDRAFSGVTSVTQDHNLFSSGAGMEGSSVGDPMFVDAAAGDFRLQPGSPAIDVGADVGLVRDLWGTALPQGAGFDIGAFEFVP